MFLQEKTTKKAIVESLRYCIKNKDLNVYAYCLMTNHLHLIVNCNEPFQLQRVIRDFKRHTLKQVLFQIVNEPESRRDWMLKLFENNGKKSKANQKIKFWQSGNHAIELYSETFVWQKINYIHQNPVDENFVSKPEEWKYSSASNYINGGGVLEEVFCLPPMQKIV